jgi:hypothetical protein
MHLMRRAIVGVIVGLLVPTTVPAFTGTWVGKGRCRNTLNRITNVLESLTLEVSNASPNTRARLTADGGATYTYYSHPGPGSAGAVIRCSNANPPGLYEMLGYSAFKDDQEPAKLKMRGILVYTAGAYFCTYVFTRTSTADPSVPECPAP